MEVHSAMETVFWQVVFKLHWKTWEMELNIPFDWLYYKIVFAINISDKKSRRFDLSEVIFKRIKVL